MTATAPAGLIVGTCPIQLWSLTGTERARRTLKRAGISVIAADANAAAAAPSCLMVRADWVVDPTLVSLLVKDAPGGLLISGGIAVAAHVAGSDVAAISAILAAPVVEIAALPNHIRVTEHDPAAPFIYLPLLRKRLKPVVLPLSEASIDEAERATFKGAYKDVTDVVTKYVWPTPARHVTRWCAKVGLTPNMVTLASLVLVFVAMGLFAQGWFALGLVAAWIMTFLDTVDGKLARVTLNSSKFGNIFDHGIDMIHPPFWWWAWHVGCQQSGVTYPLAESVLAVVVIGYVVLRLQEAAFILLFGMQIHVWRRFDSLFRLVVARRNPILILLSVGVIFGAPGIAMTAVAAWTLISIALHMVQTIQALQARRTQPIVSWMAG